MTREVYIISSSGSVLKNILTKKKNKIRKKDIKEPNLSFNLSGFTSV